MTFHGERVRVRQVRPISPTVLRPRAMPSSSSVGRVGALAVALGVGAAVVAMPFVAFADTTGSAGSSSTASGQAHSGPRSHRGAASRSAPPSVDPGFGSSAAQDSGSAASPAGRSPGSHDVSSTKSAPGNRRMDSGVQRLGDASSSKAIMPRPAARSVGMTDPVTRLAVEPESGDSVLPDEVGEIAAPVASAGIPATAATPRGVSALASEVLSWLGAGVGVGVGDGSDGSGAGGALTWAALGFVRRDGVRGHKGVVPDASNSGRLDGEAADPGLPTAASMRSTAGAGGLWSFLFGNGPA